MLELRIKNFKIKTLDKLVKNISMQLVYLLLVIFIFLLNSLVIFVTNSFSFIIVKNLIITDTKINSPYIITKEISEIYYILKILYIEILISKKEKGKMMNISLTYCIFL